jgi:hypothetical protein
VRFLSCIAAVSKKSPFLKSDKNIQKRPLENTKFRWSKNAEKKFLRFFIIGKSKKRGRRNNGPF